MKNSAEKTTLLADRRFSFGATHPPTVSYVVFDVTYGGRVGA